MSDISVCDALSKGDISDERTKRLLVVRFARQGRIRRLVASRCARRVTNLVRDARFDAALDVAERFAYGGVTEVELGDAYLTVHDLTGEVRAAASEAKRGHKKAAEARYIAATAVLQATGYDEGRIDARVLLAALCAVRMVHGIAAEEVERRAQAQVLNEVLEEVCGRV